MEIAVIGHMVSNRSHSLARRPPWGDFAADVGWLVGGVEDRSQILSQGVGCIA